MLSTDRDWFRDEGGRRLILRGCNLGGDCKLPYRPGNTLATPETFLDWQSVTFAGRPFPLDEAAEHLDRLARWGFNLARFLISWEGLEPKGPGQYDESYYDYIERVVALAGERGIRLFIDPHQDVWSRWTGGDGAPAWTLEAIGFDLANLHRSGAAFVHEMAPGPYPRMLWPANYARLACATMFTLFFAGDDFAPGLHLDGTDARSFLQGHYIAAVARLAGRLAKYDAVIGFDTLNEPSDGYIGLGDISRFERCLSKTGPMPSPFQAMAAGSGYPTEVDLYGTGLSGQSVKGRATLGEQDIRAWKPGVECLWRREGVWDEAGGKAVLRKPDHFAIVRGARPDFETHYLKPFMRSVGEAISREAGKKRFMLFLEAVPSVGHPRWSEEDTAVSGVSAPVNASHWYDGLTLFLKRWTGFVAWDTEHDRLVLGPQAIRRYFAEHLGRLRRHGLEELGAPTVVGEFGLPFDMNGAQAFRTGNYRMHEKALGAYYDALDENLLSATVWNYTASNTHARGDGWNGEDLSIWNKDEYKAGRTETGDPADAGGRALRGFVRPYARATAGLPLSMAFNPRNGEFRFEFQPDPVSAGPAIPAGPKGQTEIYIPDIQYPRGYSISVEGGEHHLEDGDGYSMLLVEATQGVGNCRVVIRRSR
jgi:hypothetical protein